MIAYAIIASLALLGLMCGALAVFVGLQGERRLAEREAEFHGDVSPKDHEEFRSLLDSHASALLQHLVRFRQRLGPCGVRDLAQAFLESSGMNVRNRVLATFVDVYGQDNPDERSLHRLIERFENLREDRNGVGCAGLLAEVARTSPAQLTCLQMLTRLFTISEAKITKCRQKLEGLSLPEIPSNPSGVEYPMAQLLREIEHLMQLLVENLPKKHVKDRVQIRQNLQATLDGIQMWFHQSSALKDRMIDRSPEVVLTRQLALRFWEKTQDGFVKRGGKPVVLDDVRSGPGGESPVITSALERSRTARSLWTVAFIFWGLAGVTWFGLQPRRFDPARSIESLVEIRTPEGQGTGFFIRDGRLIVTNHHVVSSFENVTVRVKRRGQPEAPVRVLEARTLAIDPAHDMAVLRLTETYGDSLLPLGLVLDRQPSCEPGQEVFILGNPLGHPDVCRRGALSMVREDVFWVDANIDRGDSGGPVCNTRGVVIGITTALLKPPERNLSQGIAIPSSRAWELIRQVKARERR